MTVGVLFLSSFVYAGEGVGRLALKYEPAEWKHSETQHFGYHFKDAKAAETVFVHSEATYQWIQNLFKIPKNEEPKAKVQVYVFEKKEEWQRFLKEIQTPFEGEAFVLGDELFLFREPFWLKPIKSLAHELTHVILQQFLKGPIPLALNEGFAEYASYRAIAARFGGDDYAARTLQLIAPEDYIKVSDLLKIKEYPQGKIELFYQESELLVRFLILRKSGPVFYDFLQRLSQNEAFDRALEEVYGLDLETLENEFSTYSLKK